MKQILSLLMVLGFCSFLSGKGDKDLCRVKKINGIETYIMCEPLRDYEVLVDVATGLKAESLLTGGLVNKSISGRVEQFITRAKKENNSIEAVIYSSGKRIVGVKFKDAGTASNKGIGRVSKMKNHFVFVMCEPMVEYDILKSIGGGVKWKSALTGGIVNNSIEEDVQKIISKLGDVKGADAYFFDGSKQGDAISFK